MSQNFTETEYKHEVEATAENILNAIEEYPEDYADDPWQAIHEDVDNHEWIINSHYHLDVLQHSEAGPQEWQTYLSPDDEDNHRKVLEAMAYTAFRQDVSEAVMEELDDH